MWRRHQQKQHDPEDDPVFKDLSSIFIQQATVVVPGPTPESAEFPATRPDVPVPTSIASITANAADPVLSWVALRQQYQLPRKDSRNTIPQHMATLEFAWPSAIIKKPLGVGSFGKVFLGELHHSEVALKLLLDAKALTIASAGPASSSMDASGTIAIASRERLVDEVAVMASLRHPNVVLLVGFCFEPPCLALEYCARGSVFSILQRAGTDPATASWLTWERRVKMAANAAAAMLHLHSRSPLCCIATSRALICWWPRMGRSKWQTWG